MKIKIQPVRPKIALTKVAQRVSIGAMAAKVATKVAVQVQPDILLDSTDAVLPEVASIQERLTQIDGLLAAEQIPVERIRSGLKDVMTCLKDNEGSIMELEPTDISRVVQSYIKIADVAVQEILTKKKPATKKTAAKKLAAAKDVNLDDVEF